MDSTVSKSRPKERGVSVIVCCYNSEKRLPATLTHLMHLQAGLVPWEIIVVDNCSTDRTAEVAGTLLAQVPDITSRVVHEAVPGLSFARLKGIAEAQYEYLLFCDDDNWLAPDYLQKAFDQMEQNPSIGALGGLGFPAFEGEAPKWFAEYAAFYAVGPQFPTPGPVSGVRNIVYGAGMVIRASAFHRIEQHGFQFMLSGRKGGKLSSGEDSELCWALRIAGYQIWYDETMTFRHFIEVYRLTETYRKKLTEGIAGSFYGKVYWYVGKEKKVQPIRFFWQKELLYTTKSIAQELLRLGFLTEKGKASIRRNWQFLQFVIRENEAYSQALAKVQQFYHSFQPS